MTDLEITRLCAEAMEIIDAYPMYGGNPYDPFHDDAQAMALVKKFLLSIDPAQPIGWHVAKQETKFFDAAYAHEDDLNHAICECVAKMQQAKIAIKEIAP